jgi:RES domain
LAEAYAGQWPEVAICPHARALWIRPVRPLDLLDLTSDGALAIGAVGTLAWGDEPRDLTQRWARWIYEQYSDLDGIWYRAAHQGGEAAALWDRARRDGAEGGDRSLWTVWRYVQVELARQRRQPRRIPARHCTTCRDNGYAGEDR